MRKVTITLLARSGWVRTLAMTTLKLSGPVDGWGFGGCAGGSGTGSGIGVGSGAGDGVGDGVGPGSGMGRGDGVVTSPSWGGIDSATGVPSGSQSGPSMT